LTLRAGTGFHPVLGHVLISDSVSPSAVDVAVQGVTVTSDINAFLHTQAGGSLTLRGIHVQELAPSADPALEVDLRVATTVSIEGNVIEPAQDSPGVFVDARTSAGEPVSTKIVGNTVTGQGGSSGTGGIGVQNEGPGPMDATVDGNSIWDAATWG